MKLYYSYYFCTSLPKYNFSSVQFYPTHFSTPLPTKSTMSMKQKKTPSQEVGEDSKLARSFERIRSIVRRRRLARKEKKYPKLEQIVNDVMAQQIAEKKKIRSSNKHYLTVEIPQKSLYRHSYQVSGLIILPVRLDT